MVRENLQADHFDLYLIIYSPLVWIFGSYTLLIIQIVSVLFGGLGVYRYFREDRFLAAFAMLFFFSFFGVHIALAYDFHDSVVIAMLVPWLFVFSKERKMRQCIFMIVVLWLGKENSALWIAFICFGLAILNWKERKWKWFYVISGFSSLIYFMVIMKFVMPALAVSGTYPHFNYSNLGTTLGEAVAHLIMHPVDSFHLMVSNFSGDVTADNLKSDLIKYLLFSGILLLFFRPAYLLMLIPIFFQKLFHNTFNLWGAGYHYCIEFAPILAIGIFEVIGKLKKSTFRKISAGILVVLAMSMTYKRLGSAYLYAPKKNLDFLSKDHYVKEYDIRPLYKAFRLIPDDAIVSCQTILVPHLANRDFCYTYPVIKDAEYVLLAKKDVFYPVFHDSVFRADINRFRTSEDWIKLIDNNEAFLVKRRKK